MGGLKAKINELEGKCRSEKAEKDKLNELLKGKEEVYFTLRTEIKRKEIEMEGLIRSLEEYRG